MKKIIMRFLMLISTAYLTACSSLNSQFDCPMKPGVRCESLDQVNAKVDSGEIGNAITVNSMNPSYNQISVGTFKTSFHPSGGEPLRYGETVMRVWMAPYEDTSGNYHQESDVYTVVKPGHWIGYPPKETSVEE